MKTLTPTEYQSLPVNEKCNWKETFEQATFTNGWEAITKRQFEWHYENHSELNPPVHKVRRIYIPINPESVLNAEMGERFTLDDIASKYALIKDTGNQYSIYGLLKSAFLEGHNHATKTIIDIVEAEINDCDYCASQCSDEIAVKICNAEKSALKVVLRKLKEIK